MKSLQGAKAIMFHHFDDNTHPKVQGSINKTEFVSLLQKIMQNYKIIEPRHFTEKIRNGNIEENEIVITFDDSLKSQFDVAYPILKQYGLKAFFLFIQPHLRANKPILKFTGIFERRNLRILNHSINPFLVNLTWIQLISIHSNKSPIITYQAITFTQLTIKFFDT